MVENSKKIGLLGGSFNPAHDGHIYISKQALEHISLDEIWWLVSPQNPLKSEEELAPFEERIATAREVVKEEPQIQVSELEQELGTQYTFDTLTKLKERFPDTQFVWLMGEDNLAQFDQWHRWEEIFQLVPIAVFAREHHDGDALTCTAAKQFEAQHIDDPTALLNTQLPAWCHIAIDPHPASATAIRNA